MVDRPGMTVDFGAKFAKNMCFQGEIWDTCARKKKEEDEFRLFMSGTMKGPPPKVEWAARGKPTWRKPCGEEG